MSKTLIVSNRLPVKTQVMDGQVSFSPSEGGLATGLSSIYQEGDSLWIGWPGTFIEDPVQQQQIEASLAELKLAPVLLTLQEIEQYYGGFSNGILWPICHYMPSLATYLQEYWEAYEEANRKFANAVLANVEAGDTVWVHDYQLLLVPQFVREQMPELSIGYFHHIPFPSYEVFRQIPWRDRLLNGVMGADLIGFHTYDDLRHFVSAATRILGVSASVNQLMVNSRPVMVDAFPMGIDYQKFVELTTRERVQRHIGKARQAVREARMILSVDRLDYSKGILQRLQAYDLFLNTHPEYKEKVSLLMVVVPSRDRVPHYRELKKEIDRTVSNINARYQTLGWQPVLYLYRSISQELLSAMYQTADVCLVTPLRDGMNLVSKEYVASRTDEQGVLILSEMAGASKELSEAIILNPNNVTQLADAIYRALEMPVEEQRERMRAMRSTVRKFDVFQWVSLFMQRLAEVKKIQQALLTKRLRAGGVADIRQQYAKAGKRLILLDYDGTLMGFNVDPLRVRPDKELYNLLEELAADPKNRLVIISGRKHETLEEWLGKLPLDFIAEHGAWTKWHGQSWQKHPGLNDEWKLEVLPVMETYADRTPGALIEEKSYSLSWHYRKAERGLGEQRAAELENNLTSYAIHRGLQILQGDKVIEIKSHLVNKGNAARRWLEADSYEFILAAGDDHTDEDTFKAMPPHAVTIKVGSNVSAAKYSLSTFQDVRRLLKEFVADRAPAMAAVSATGTIPLD
jgi:trehalose 6-phosphate synthase/phosphatase